MEIYSIVSVFVGGVGVGLIAASIFAVVEIKKKSELWRVERTMYINRLLDRPIELGLNTSVLVEDHTEPEKTLKQHLYGVPPKLAKEVLRYAGNTP